MLPSPSSIAASQPNLKSSELNLSCGLTKFKHFSIIRSLKFKVLLAFSQVFLRLTVSRIVISLHHWHHIRRDCCDCCHLPITGDEMCLPTVGLLPVPPQSFCPYLQA